MNPLHSVLSRRSLLSGALSGLGLISFGANAKAAQSVTDISTTQILGRPTANSISLSFQPSQPLSAYIEYGLKPTSLTLKTATTNIVNPDFGPVNFELVGLKPNLKYYYRLRYATQGSKQYLSGKQYAFSTQKAPGAPFTFTVTGDSHPERVNQMFNSDLYFVTLGNIASQQPDFHIMLGDDFSIDPLISQERASAATVEGVYKTQRNWLSTAGANVPIFLINGNHEQAAEYLLDGTTNNPAVWAGSARLKYYAVPQENSFYSVDSTVVPGVGAIRDYYSWSWGDALFVTLDPYWHSKNPVDSVAGGQGGNGGKGGGQKTRDLWTIGIGDEQYAWFKKTLESSKAKYKFVFTHHVLGTGRGGIEVSTNYEWGGSDPKGISTFADERPNWSLPIHDLMVANNVTIFFQGHDHIFVHQERDGVVYQSMPNPADNTFTYFNSDAYLSGTKAPNSGHVRVSVSPTGVLVEYFLAARPEDSAIRQNLTLAHSYTVTV